MPLTEWQDTAGYFRRISPLKKLFWLYFLLLIFEGALRKWVFPEYSAPLLLVRDPIAMLIIVEAYRENKWPERWSLTVGILAVLLIGLCLLQVVMGNNPWIAALYGLRSYLLPFPVAFVMGENLDAEDLRKFGVCSMWLMLPETALETAQYLSPSNSYLNAGAYEGATQIGYAGAHARASGTFSFVVGPGSYGPMVAAFILYGLASDKFARKWLLWAAAFAVLISLPLTGSRSFLVSLGAVVASAGVAAAFGVSQFLKSLRIIFPLFAVFILASFLPVFSRSSKDLNERIQGGSMVEGGGSFQRAVAHRTVIPLETTILQTDFSSNPIGLGMGRGAAAVTKVLEGRIEFLAGENEIERAIIELGPFPGVAFTLFRFGLAGWVIFGAISRAREGESLALLFVPIMASAVTLGILEQPTGQGFMVMFLAFSLAALKPRAIVASRAPASGRLGRPILSGGSARYSGSRVAAPKSR
ncbi:MAG: hypothetical protein ABSF23_01795 [Terracidiphilus sp.]|jgi:hypothetical protein